MPPFRLFDIIIAMPLRHTLPAQRDARTPQSAAEARYHAADAVSHTPPPSFIYSLRAFSAMRYVDYDDAAMPHATLPVTSYDVVAAAIH